MRETACKRDRFNVRSNRKAFFPELEKELNEFVVDARRKGSCISGLTVRKQALVISNRLGITTFKGIILLLIF